MVKSQSLWSSVRKAFMWFCLVAVNCLALFVILNLGIWGYSHLSELRTKASEPEKTPMRYKKSNDALEKLFPNLSKQDIDQLIYDSRRIVQEYDSFTQFKEAPYRTKYVNVDTKGFRHSRNQGPWPPLERDFVIFFFGGSTSFGYGVPDHETVASHLQEILSQKLRIPVKIYNFGRAAYFSSQERILFQKLLLDGHVPNMAIFMDGVNEFILYDGEPGYTNQFKAFMKESEIPLSRKIINELPLVKFVKGLGSSSESVDSNRETKDKTNNSKTEHDLLARAIQRYMVNKKIIEAIASDFGVRSVFVWQPMPLYGYDLANHIFKDFDYDKFTPHLKRGYEFVSEGPQYRERGQNFIWLADMQAEIKQPLYVSAFHYGPQMSRSVADGIASAMVSRNLVPLNSYVSPKVVTMSGNQTPEVSFTGTE